MIHYHGTPISGSREVLLRMAGRHFCVSYAAPQQLDTCLQIGQSVMLDNGAFSAFTKNEPFNESGFQAWCDPILHHPHWAVIPDVIDGAIDAQRDAIRRWPFNKWFSAPVWHMALPIEYLLELADEWPRVCIGSTARYWNIGSPEWCRRMDEAFNALAARHQRLPWIHGLRMLGMAGQDWPLASADSTNVAQNWSRQDGCPDVHAARLDAIQTPRKWRPREGQCDMFT